MLWKNINNEVILQLNQVDKKYFNIVSQPGINLIYPKRNKWDWESDEKWLRSIIVDDKGHILSCSFPKFGNYNEFKDDTNILNSALRNGDVVRFSNKEDGSLCIRSVINGEVIFRTRGTAFGGSDHNNLPSFGKRFRHIAENKYPILLDPKYKSNITLLFEYISPENAIVIHYKESDLIFLGAVKHNLTLLNWDELNEISKNDKLNLVKLHILPNDPNEILEKIKIWKSEGIVARTNNDQTLVKIKSAYYLANHRMRFGMNYLSIVDMVEMSNISNEEDLINILKECEYDWEVISSAKKLYKEYKQQYDKVMSWLDAANEQHEKIIKELPSHLSDIVKKKEYAALIASNDKKIKTIMFLIYHNKQNKLYNFLKKLIRNRS